jgi:ABC-2 type transport system permease protein
MMTIFKKEIAGFFSSLIGYVVLAVFLLGIGLFTWILPEYSLLEYGYANLDTLFSMGPFVFLFLLPALTMRMLAEERKNNTIELLYTKPITEMQVVLGKYLAGLVLLLMALLPTLIYLWTIGYLAEPRWNLDMGSILGSYFGLFLLGAAFTAIGIFCSSLVENQVVSFLMSLLLCALLYVVPSSLALLFDGKNAWMELVQQLGMDEHYNSMSRGVLDTRDLLYFLGLILLFLNGTKVVLESRKW